MNDFDFDIAEKKRIARGAAARRCGSKSRKCTLPSDYLTAAQKKGLNGKVNSYNLSRPMSYAQFTLMPKDLQREYMTKLRSVYHASGQQIGLMMGCSPETVRQVLIRLNFNTSARRVMNREQRQRWEAWLTDAANEPELPIPTPNEVPTDEPEVNPVPSEESRPEKSRSAPDCGAMLGGKLRLSGSADEIICSLGTVFSAIGAGRMDVSISFNLYRKEVTK